MSPEQVAKINKVRAAMKKVRRFLKREGRGIAAKKQSKLIQEFAEIAGLKPPGQKSAAQWLADLWDSQIHEFIQRQELGFYQRPAWLELKTEVFKKYGRRCMKCGSLENPSVDHIKPISLFPELGLDFNNMQVLCLPCNSGKSNKHMTDYRTKAQA
jgi:hypothetical protein